MSRQSIHCSPDPNVLHQYRVAGTWLCVCVHAVLYMYMWNVGERYGMLLCPSAADEIFGNSDYRHDCQPLHADRSGLATGGLPDLEMVLP